MLLGHNRELGGIFTSVGGYPPARRQDAAWRSGVVGGGMLRSGRSPAFKGGG